MIDAAELLASAARLRELEAAAKAEYNVQHTAGLPPHLARANVRPRVALELYQEALAAAGTQLSKVEAGVRAGEPEAIADALSYLEVRPRYFGSGYLAEELMRRLVQGADLRPHWRRIDLIAAGYSASTAGRELAFVGRLVGKAWCDELEAALLARVEEAESAGRAVEAGRLNLILMRAAQWVRSNAF